MSFRSNLGLVSREREKEREKEGKICQKFLVFKRKEEKNKYSELQKSFMLREFRDFANFQARVSRI